jgi:hypothetical protein
VARAVLLIYLMCGSGCLGCIGGNEESPFPPGLEPLEENTAPDPESTPDDPYPEVVSIVHDDGLDYSWAHARGFIKAPTSAVWAAMQEPLTVADRRRTDEQLYEFGVEPEYEFSFLTHYVVNDLVTVEWDEVWRFGAIEGPKDAPVFGLARFQKIYGSSFIDLLEGSMIVYEIDENTSEVQFIEHLDALMTGSDTVAGYMGDLYESVKERAHGRPLPVY